MAKDVREIVKEDILEALGLEEGAVPTTEIEPEIKVSHGCITRALEELAEEALIRREGELISLEGDEDFYRYLDDELNVEVEKVRNARRARRGSVSLDKPLQEGEAGGGKALEDIIANEDAPRPELEPFGDMLEDRLMGLFDQVLSDLERQILKLRYRLKASVPDS